MAVIPLTQARVPTEEVEKFREVADSLLMGWEWEVRNKQYLVVPLRP